MFYKIFLTGKGYDGTRTRVLGPVRTFLYYEGKNVGCESRNYHFVAHKPFPTLSGYINNKVAFSILIRFRNYSSLLYKSKHFAFLTFQFIRIKRFDARHASVIFFFCWFKIDALGLNTKINMWLDIGLHSCLRIWKVYLWLHPKGQ